MKIFNFEYVSKPRWLTICLHYGLFAISNAFIPNDHHLLNHQCTVGWATQSPQGTIYSRWPNFKSSLQATSFECWPKWAVSCPAGSKIKENVGERAGRKERKKKVLEKNGNIIGPAEMQKEACSACYSLCFREQHKQERLILVIIESLPEDCTSERRKKRQWVHLAVGYFNLLWMHLLQSTL